VDHPHLLSRLLVHPQLGGDLRHKFVPAGHAFEKVLVTD
jgi:hypothetical protein